jgi:uncharacterized membrane protein
MALLLPAPPRPDDSNVPAAPRASLWTVPVARSLATLAGAGASAALFGWSFTLSGGLTAFLTKNEVTHVEGQRALVALAAGAAAPALVALLAAGRGGGGAARLGRAADVASPFAVLFALPALFDYAAWHDAPLTYLVALTLVALGFERLLHRALVALGPDAFEGAARAYARRRRLWGRWAPLAVVLAAAAGYAAYMGHYSLLNHRRFGTSSFDLAIYDNLIFNATRGEPFRTTILFGPGGGNNLASHAEFAVVAFAPVYALFPRAETLLVLQSVLLGFAAVPLYLFAATQVPRWTAALVACAYLFYAPLHGPNFYDFHWLPLAVFFHFWLYYAIATRRTWLVVGALAMLYALREDIAVGLTALGVFLALTGARPRLGTALAAVSALWFVVDKFVIMPWAGKWWFANMYKDLFPKGESGYGSILKTIATNPFYTLSTLLKEGKVVYLLHLLAPLALLPARRLSLLLLASHAVLFTVLTTGYAPTISIAFQYTTHWIPYLFGGAVLVLRRLGAEGGAARRRAALGAVCLATLSHSYVFGAVLQRHVFVGGFRKIAFDMGADEWRRYHSFREVAALIPREATVAATDAESPHVSARPTAYSLRDHHGDAEYLLVSKDGLDYGGARKNLEDALGRNVYGLVKRDAYGLYLFKRGAELPGTDEAIESLGLKPKRKKP